MAETDDLLKIAATTFRESEALMAGSRVFSWSELDTIVERTAAWLHDQGVAVGDRIGIVENNCIELAVLLWSLIRVGAVATLFNPRHPAALLKQLKADTDSTRQVVINSGPVDLGAKTRIIMPTLDELMAAHATTGMTRPDLLASDRPATIVFTSGSTGDPKPALHTLANHYYNAVGSNDINQVGPGDRWLLSLPLYHVGGLGILFRCTVGGGCVVLPDRQLDLSEQIMRDSISHLSLVPTQLRRLLSEPCLPNASRSLKTILLGGGPIPTGLVKEACEAGLTIRPTYGMTEMSSQIATANDDHPDQLRLLKHGQCEIAADGEIKVRGKTLFAGYTRGDTIDPARDADGWFHSGDTGRFDQGGGLIVMGRKDNMFVSGGENIHPEQIEAALGDVDCIREALVVPVDDAEFGHRPVAFIKCRTNAECKSDVPVEQPFCCNHAPLTEQLEKRLPRFMIPVTFYPWPQSYEPTGLKTDRLFFRRLAEKLQRPSS